jgi:hypothetical protein
MALWGNKDDAANSDIAATMQVNRSPTTGNQTILYGNTRPNTFFSGMTIGQFGVDTNEITAMQTTAHPQHAGWVLRKVGTGLRAGRVTYETLVAMGSMSGDGNSTEDIYFPDRRIVIGTQPLSNTTALAGNITFTTVVTTVPTGGTVAYKWQYNNISGAAGWVDVANTAGRYFNNTSPILTANNVTANGNVFRVVVTSTGANTVNSSNATILRIV